MNNPFNMYNQSVPFLTHTDWASVAKQWATHRADVNIPQSMNDHHSYQNIPPPPPPSPPIERNMEYSMNSYENYSSMNHDMFSNINHNHVQSNAMTSHQTPAYSIFEDKSSLSVKSKCETFDYNHGNRPYEYYNNIELYTPPVTTAVYSQNMWTQPPPDYPEILQSNFPQRTYTPPEVVSVPKLFPIVNVSEFSTNNVTVRSSPVFLSNNKPVVPKPDNSKMHDGKFDITYAITKPTKGLPAWIIDDMKKMKDKERKQTYHSMDTYKDNPVHSRRDSEGDVVMEDAHKVNDSDLIMPGKNVTKHAIDSSTTEADIDDVSLHDDDEIVRKVDISSKSFTELVDMLDETELETLKMMVIRDSLTDVMKEITDDMIFKAVKSTFSHELSRGKKTHKHRGNSDSFDRPSKKQRPEAIGQLLGLAVYESDEDEETTEAIPAEGLRKTEDSLREKWSTHNKHSDSMESKTPKIKNSSDIIDGNTSGEQLLKHRRDKDKRKSHKKSRKRSSSNELRDEKSKKDQSGSSRKKSKKDRSRS